MLQQCEIVRRILRSARIAVEHAVHVGPETYFIGVQSVTDDRRGEIGAVAAEGGDFAFRRSADKSSYHGHDSLFHERQQRFTRAAARFLPQGLGIQEILVRLNAFGGIYSRSANFGLLQRACYQSSAGAFSVRKYGSSPRDVCLVPRRPCNKRTETRAQIF